MKNKIKSITTNWAVALVFGLVVISFVPNANAQSFIQPSLSINTISQNLSTPDAIAKFLWRNFQFQEDQEQFGKEEYWQTPEEFLANKKGDCEDFALLSKALLNKIGKKAFLVNVYGHKFAHTVTVYEEDGVYNVIDGSKVKRFEAKSLEEVMTKIYPHWNEAAIVGMSKKTNNGRILKKFERDAKVNRAFSLSL